MKKNVKVYKKKGKGCPERQPFFVYFRGMYRFLFAACLILVACSPAKDEQFCECLEAGDALNEASQHFMTEIPTEKDQQNIQELKEKKTEACKNYTEMSGEEMRTRKKACEEAD